MFDLNEEISMWRSNLTLSETLGGSDIDELESHLREEIESLVSRSLSEKEAFWLARRRLGGVDDLSGEFAKINKSAVLRERLFWMAAGVLAYMLAIQSGAAASKIGVLLAALGGLRGPGLGIVHVTSQMVVLVGALSLAYLICRKFCDRPGLNRRAGGATERTILLAALGLLFAMCVVTRVSAVGVPGWIGVEDCARVAIVSAYTQLVLTLLLPVVTVVAMIRLRRSNSAEIGA